VLDVALKLAVEVACAIVVIYLLVWKS